MKKSLLFLAVCLTCCSCRKAKSPVLRDEWADYRKAYAWKSRQQDSAFYYFNRTVSGSKDSLAIAMAGNNMAVIQSDAGDYYGAMESLANSLKFLDEKNPRHRACLANDYNELGMNSNNLKNYDAAISYFDRALILLDDRDQRAQAINNQAVSYGKNGDFPKALQLYQQAPVKGGKSGGAYAQALTNIAATRWLANPKYPAAAQLRQALLIRELARDRWGQNSSYAHLVDYYAAARPDSALFYASAMYRVARSLNSPDDQLEALDKLVRLSPPRESKHWFLLYRSLADSVQSARNAAKNQFALIRYDVERQQAVNLSLQKDNAEKRYQIGYQRILLIFALCALVAGSGFAAFWFRKRRQRLELDKENAIQENRLKTARKVHDVLANGIYRVMSAVENQDSLDKDALLDSMEALYERTRDISYEEPEFDCRDFHLLISELLTAFATQHVRVVLVGNSPSFWEGVTVRQRSELYYILQELMVNMRKHSGAVNVAVLFERQGKRLAVNYADDGQGMPDGVLYKNGLTNTGNRMKIIGGLINFDSQAGKGTEIRITFPVA